MSAICAKVDHHLTLFSTSKHALNKKVHRSFGAGADAWYGTTICNCKGIDLAMLPDELTPTCLQNYGGISIQEPKGLFGGDKVEC